MRAAIKTYMEFCEANPEVSAEAFIISKGDFELYCKVMDFGAHVFMRADIAGMDREMANMKEVNEGLDILMNLEFDSDLNDAINLNPSEAETELYKAEHDMKTDEPYEFAAMKEEAEKLEEKRKMDEHPIGKLFAEFFGGNMGVWL